jgi:hypothetical protein
VLQGLQKKMSPFNLYGALLAWKWLNLPMKIHMTNNLFQLI